MNYKNANLILPDRLVQEIQQYVQGEYIYIPIKDKVMDTFDLCYFMLGWLSKEEVLDISEKQWFDILANFFAGYEQENELL